MRIESLRALDGIFALFTLCLCGVQRYTACAQIIPCDHKNAMRIFPSAQCRGSDQF